MSQIGRNSISLPNEALCHGNLPIRRSARSGKPPAERVVEHVFGLECGGVGRLLVEAGCRLVQAAAEGRLRESGADSDDRVAGLLRACLPACLCAVRRALCSRQSQSAKYSVCCLHVFVHVCS